MKVSPTRRRGEPEPVLLGSLEEQVLLAVVRTGEAAAYGMNVRRELDEVTGRDVAIGAVYATLDRLEAKGLATSTRAAAADGASRRIFAVTPLGTRSLALTRATRERLWSGVRLERVPDT